MKENHSRALIVAYYLSKFDEVGYQNLGYPTKDSTHAYIGSILDVNPNTVKNMRDEFDPYHLNKRAGWHSRPLRPSRVKVIDLFQNLTEEELRIVVVNLFDDEINGGVASLGDIISYLSEVNDDLTVDTDENHISHVSRSITGSRAEQLFMEYHAKHLRPESGTLIDTRDWGCGYDFKLNTDAKILKIEVKGLREAEGGITFTNKEWDTARREADLYYLVLVKNVFTRPIVQIIQDPSSVLSMTPSLVTRVELQWHATDKELQKK